MSNSKPANVKLATVASPAQSRRLAFQLYVTLTLFISITKSRVLISYRDKVNIVPVVMTA